MFEIPRPYSRPSSTNALGWKPGTCASQGSRPEYDVSMCPLNMRLGPPPAPGTRAEHVRATVLDLLPLHLQAHVEERLAHELGHRLLRAGEARRADRPRRPVDEPVSDRCGRQPRTCGSTFSPKSRIWSCRRSPQSSSMTWVQPASRYSSIAAMQSVGRAGDRLAAVEDRVGHLRLRREPAALLHRLGDRRGSRPSRSRPGRAACLPSRWMFCTLFARYIPAISRAPSRPASRSVSWIEATTVQPMSMSAATFSRV